MNDPLSGSDIFPFTHRPNKINEKDSLTMALNNWLRDHFSENTVITLTFRRGAQN
jgi:hypothetical protein